LEEEIRSKERANRSLVTQVQSLEKKVKDNNVGNLESELEYYKSQCEFLSKELTQARDLVRLYSSGSRYSSVNTFLLGETTIHCNLLDDGRYRVYFSPRKRTVRFIPDDGGEILCSDRKVSVSAFRYYTAFDKVRELSAVKEGDETVIAFGDPGY
ncbi:MAG: hypothetical protein MJZ68_07685, partial [archaeon]|nr:hypothetical protein [archaeon]